jgi:hypothetical protein
MEDEDNRTKDGSDKSDSDQKKSLRRSWKSSGQVAKLTAVFAGIAAGATFIYAIAAVWQLVELKNATEVSRDSLIRVQRAFIIFPADMSVQGDVPDPKTMKVNLWEFSVPFENSGVTPARAVDIHVDIYPSEGALPDNFGFQTGAHVPSQLVVIGPKEKTGTGHLTATPEVIKAVQDKKAHLYIYGWCSYRDIFQKAEDIAHVTKFCYELSTFGGDPFSGLGQHSGFWITCPHHNCADEDCANEPYPSPP